MTIIDAHMHLPVNYGSLAEKKKALLEEMRSSGVSGGIVISDSELESGIGSMSECAELFDGCEEVSVVGGISPFIAFREQLALLERLLREKKLVGIKLFCGHEPIFLNSPELLPIFALAEKYGVPVLFHSGWDDPRYSAPEIIRLAASANPGVRFVCCHCCYPELDRCFKLLRNSGNVFFDISSVADIPETREIMRTAIERALHIDPERFIFGSDFGSCGQKEHIAFAKGLELSDYERERLFSLNARRLYSI